MKAAPPEDHIDATRARQVASTIALVIAGATLVVWATGLDFNRNLAPMSPLTAVGFVFAALGTRSLTEHDRLAHGMGALTFAVGLAGLIDGVLGDGRALNTTLFGADARISVFTASALLALGVATALNGRGLPVTRWLAMAAGAVGGAALIGFLLGVPLFYGSGRPVQMSWQAAVCSVLNALAIIWAHPRGHFFHRGLTGRFARRMLPTVLGIPIVSGALATAAARADWWSYSVAAWVMTLAAVAGLAFVVARAVERLADDDRRLTELAIRDPLTGAYNRRHFLAAAELAAARTSRYGESAAIAVVDLDRFKEVNDQWGHAAGDEALVRVNRALRSRLRSSDVLGRIGGDEFAALILNVTQQEATLVASQMRSAVTEVGCELAAEGWPNRLGASVGMAMLTDDVDVEELLEIADQRMYADKRLTKEVERSAHH